MAKIKSLLTALLLALCLCACASKGGDKTLVIVRETPAPTSAAPETPAPDASLEDGDWYGWWRMTHTSGDWTKMYGYYWDCCAELRREDGSLSLLLWDEDMPKDDWLAKVSLTERDGVLRCGGGAFLDRELSEDSWTITRTRDACGELLHIRGVYKAVGKGGFDYDVYLRPWGSRWPGSADERPFSYESWYLPLIEAGEEMPDKLG